MHVERVAAPCEPFFQRIGSCWRVTIVAVEPLASLDADRLVAAVAPNLQRYLVEPLGG